MSGHVHNDEHKSHELKHDHSHGPDISCSCGHCHGHDHDDEHSHDHEHEEEMSLVRLIFAGVLLAFGLFIEHLRFFAPLKNWAAAYDVANIEIIPYFAAFMLCGKDVVIRAVKNILDGHIFDEQFLMTAASLGAIALGEFAEAVAVMLFYNVGEWFQDYAVDKSRSSISALMDIRPDKAFVLRDGNVVQVKPDEVETGQIIQVKPGERVPLDGVVEEGESFADTSALTGESVPRKIGRNDEILSGFVNQTGVILVRVTKKYGDSAVTRILQLTQSAGQVKARSEKFITKFARVYTPVVCIAALLVALVPPLLCCYVLPGFVAPEILAGNGFEKWVYRGLMFLVVSCPCALVISVPLTFFCGIGGASLHGILIKGSTFVERLAGVKTCVFDKTGTLTKGTFEVTGIFPQEGFTEEEVLAFAAHGEHFSSHPIAKSLVEAHQKNSADSPVCCTKISRSQAEEISGHGIKIILDGRQVTVGNEKLMKAEGIAVSLLQAQTGQKAPGGTIVHVAIDGKYAGCVVISDQIKEDSAAAIEALRKSGVSKTVMLTGDNEIAARAVAQKLGLDEYYPELLPQDKVFQIEQLLKDNRNGGVLFAGDGVNDSPVLARSDVGVAMGALGSDAAIEAADVVLMDDNLSKLAQAIGISRKTMAIVTENIVVSLGVKAAIMVLGAAGFSNMWTAVFGDVGVCILAILNSVRAFKK